MDFNRSYEINEYDSIKNKCTNYLYYDAILVLYDGSMINGIIEKVDNDNVNMLIGEDMQVDEDNSNMNRQPGPGFNRYNRFRRYRRRNFPINTINRVGLLPYPFYPGYSPYPMYQPYPVYPTPYPFFPL